LLTDELLRLVVRRVGILGNALLEVPDPLSETFADVRQTSSAEQQQDDQSDDDDLPGANGHGNLASPEAQAQPYHRGSSCGSWRVSPHITRPRTRQMQLAPGKSAPAPRAGGSPAWGFVCR